ncbi:MAG: protein kinase [Acidobacteriota bacterium]|nr:protein kinase [Acidobacteriota bacterium]
MSQDPKDPHPPPPASDATLTSADPTLLAPHSLFAGRYRIVGLLGVGGMGMVYRALDERLDIPVALKLLRPDRAGNEKLRARFRQELILARQVSHRNVVRIHDLGEVGEIYFLTMDFVEGQSLKEILESSGRLDPAEAVDIGRQLARGLNAAHREGVVHRDLKPGNILVSPAGRAYITDFGIASSASAAGLTVTGSIIGTPDYLSPEQARGEKADHRADLYALGLILYEMLTGDLPFAGGSLTEVLAQRISGRPENLLDARRDIPPELAAVVQRCLENDPDRRYQSAEEIGRDLSTGQAPEPLPAPSAGSSKAGSSNADSSREEARPAVVRSLPRAAEPSRVGAARSSRLWALLVVLALALVGSWATWQWANPSGAPVPVHSVAVLPLADETGRQDLAWVSNGLPELVAGELSESADLRVVDGMRVFRILEDLKISPGLIPKSEQQLLGEVLDINRLVLGQVRSVGQGLRVDARLVSLDQEGLPTQSFVAEVAAGEQVPRLVQLLSVELRRRLGVEGRDEGAAQPVTAAAASAYDEGLGALQRGDPVTAAAALERAVEEDPEFALAWMRLADVYGTLGYAQRGQHAATAAVQAAVRSDGRLALRARAQRASLEGDPEAAQGFLQELNRRYPFDTESRLQLAEIYGAAGSYDEASEVLQEITRRDPQNPEAWFLLGKFSILGGDSRRAVDDFLTRALVIHNRLDNLQGQGDVLNAFGVAYQKLGAFGDAEERYRQAAQIRQRSGDVRGHSASLFNLAMIHSHQGELEAAEQDLQTVLRLREEIGDRRGIASAYNHLGHLLERRGLYREARDYFLQGLEGRWELGDQRAIAESLNNVAFVEFMLGEYDSAAGRWSSALESYRESGNAEGEVLVGQSRAHLQLAQGHWEPALKSLLQGLEFARENGLRDMEAAAQGLLGRAAHYQGRYGAALDYYREALDTLAQLEAPAGLVEVNLDRSELLLALGLADRAEEGLERARTWLELQNNREQRARLLCLEGRLQLQRGNASQAAQRFSLALESAMASGGLAAELWSRLGLGEATAGKDLRAALKQVEAVTEESGRLEHARLQMVGGLALAELRRSSGDLGGAEVVASTAADRARQSAPLAGTYRLHSLLAEVLEARGRTRAAGEALSLAQAEIMRVRESLEGRERAAFDGLPEVRSIDRELMVEEAQPMEDNKSVGFAG